MSSYKAPMVARIEQQQPTYDSCWTDLVLRAHLHKRALHGFTNELLWPEQTGKSCKVQAIGELMPRPVVQVRSFIETSQHEL